jgi:hypothetical protein
MSRPVLHMARIVHSQPIGAQGLNSNSASSCGFSVTGSDSWPFAAVIRDASISGRLKRGDMPRAMNPADRHAS